MPNIHYAGVGSSDSRYLSRKIIEDMDKSIASRPVCLQCRSYFITHDPAKPYGCRALGFKSSRNPARVVYESSGIQCQLFIPKGDTSSGDQDNSIIA